MSDLKHSSELEQLYQQIILEHSRLRSGSGTIPEQADGLSRQFNPTCGDEVTLALNLDENGELSDLVWDGDGCSISQASVSVMNDLVMGRSRTEIEELTKSFLELIQSRGHEVSEQILDLLEDGAAFQGVSRYPARVKCALLGWMALRDALIQAEEMK